MLDTLGYASLDALVPMQRAGMATVQGQYGEALALYERHIDAACRQGLGRLAAKYLADVAWCRWHLGDTSGALRDAQAAAESMDATTQMDDRAVAHARLAALYTLLDDPDAAARHAAQGRDDWAAHRRFQSVWVDALDAAHLHP